MTPADVDDRVLASLRAGNSNARAIGDAEGMNSTAVKHSLERLEAKELAVHRGTMWKALPARGQA